MTDAQLARVLFLVLLALFTIVVVRGGATGVTPAVGTWFYSRVSSPDGYGPHPHGRPAFTRSTAPARESSSVVRVGLISRLRRKLFGPTLRWECVDCGEVHRSNPKRCANCGGTILRQKRDD